MDLSTEESLTKDHRDETSNPTKSEFRSSVDIQSMANGIKQVTL
jgi:hypothetical protein